MNVVVISSHEQRRLFWQQVAFPCILIGILAAYNFRIVFSWLPVDPDQLIALSFGTRSNPASLFSNQFLDYLPGFRPLYGLSFWLQYRLHGSDHIGLYYLVGVLLLWLIACLVFVAVRHLTGRLDAACVAAIAMLLDGRNVTSLIILDRQILLSAFFGLCGTLLAAAGRYGRMHLLGGGILLLLSTLSKEYGLAFVGAIALEALRRIFVDRNDLAARRWLGAAIAVTGIYFCMRFLLAGGAAGTFCEEQGYFWQSRRVCFSPQTYFSELGQWAYNIGATFVGTFLPSVFFGDGRLRDLSSVSLNWFAYCSIFALLAIFGAVKGPREARLAILLVACSAIMSFVLYRDRNHMIGEIGFYISGGVGLSIALSRAEKRPSTSVMGMLGALLILAALSYHSYRGQLVMLERYRELQSATYCEGIGKYAAIDKDLARAISAKFRPWIEPCP